MMTRISALMKKAKASQPVRVSGEYIYSVSGESEDGRCEKEIRSRIAKAKAAFNKCFFLC